MLESNYQGLDDPIYTNQLILLGNSGTLPKYTDSNQFEKIVCDKLSELVLTKKPVDKVIAELKTETDQLNLDFLK